jgi:acyl carrier protein
MVSQERAPEIKIWLEDYIGSVIDVPEGEDWSARRFDDLGLDSVEVTIMAGMIEERFEIEIQMPDVVDNPNVAALSKHLENRLAAG